jgi:hypothetical protein
MVYINKPTTEEQERESNQALAENIVTTIQERRLTTA